MDPIRFEDLLPNPEETSTPFAHYNTQTNQTFLFLYSCPFEKTMAQTKKMEIILVPFSNLF